jgi:hypothetical protein
MKPEDIQIEGIHRLVDGLVLGILDKISISGKWYNRDISLKTLLQKKDILNEMKEWFKDPKWRIWVSIYCDFNNVNEGVIYDNFSKIRRKSVRYVNKLIRAKLT